LPLLRYNISIPEQARVLREPAAMTIPASLRWLSPLLRQVRRRPFLWLLVLVAFTNIAATIVNIWYNLSLIVGRLMDAQQKAAFFDVAVPLYNGVAYPIGLGLMLYLIWPLRRCLADLRAGRDVSPGFLAWCRRRLVNLPAWQVLLNGLAWLPGAVVFPWIVCALGGPHRAADIWTEFAVSFVVSAFLATIQTFFLVEAYLMGFLYPEFFRDSRPAQAGGRYFSFGTRLLGVWISVGAAPLTALFVVINSGITFLAVGVFLIGLITGGLVCLAIGVQLLGWIRAHERATEQIALGRFDVRIPLKRPDEWGRLTDYFNDMASDLDRAKKLRETFGQFVSPQVRDQILPLYPTLGGVVQDVTVLFADIRGFTRRSSGQPPELVVALLNRFLTLSVEVVEDHGGWVNKFLGDGFMALFNVCPQCEVHADLAVGVALELQSRLADLNAELTADGQPPLVVGIGIHSGPALVGCIGCTGKRAGGEAYIRKEMTAIGETINLGQRVEQLTKCCGGPILLSEQTRSRLKGAFPLTSVGPQHVAGCPEALHIFRVEMKGMAGWSG
jgi:adenylate cyclase